MLRECNAKRVTKFIESEPNDVTVGLGYVRENDKRIIMQRESEEQVYFTGDGYPISANGLILEDNPLQKVVNIKSYCANRKELTVYDIIDELSADLLMDNQEYIKANELNNKLIDRCVKFTQAMGEIKDEKLVDTMCKVLGNMMNDYLDQRDLAKLHDLIEMRQEDFEELVRETAEKINNESSK